MIELKRLTKQYGDRTVIDDVSVKLNNGIAYGVIGNGASVLLSLLAGSLLPCAGSVRINGFDMQKDAKRARASVAYLGAGVPLYENMTVEEYLRFLAEVRGIAYERSLGQIVDAIEVCELSAHRRGRIARLSSDVRVRVGIAGMLIGGADVLIFDDPTKGLPPKPSAQILDLIARVSEEHTVFLKTADWSAIASLCSWVLRLEEGHLVELSSLDSLSPEAIEQIKSLLLQEEQSTDDTYREFEGEYEIIDSDEEEGR